MASEKSFIPLRTRFWILGAVFLLGFIAIGPQLPSDYEGPFFIGWFLVGAIAQFFVFRCPHCHRSAMFGPYKQYRPFLGTRCAHCGKDY